MRPAAARAFQAILPAGIAFLVAAAAPAATPHSGRGAAATVIPAAGLRDDAALLRDAFETLHPGLRRYLTPAKLEAAFHELDAEFARDRTLADAYLVVSKLTAKIRCGHTWPDFSRQSPAVQTALFQAPRVPFHFRWVDEKMVVTRPLGGAPLPRGTEILAMDGVPARKILWTLMTVTHADGGNDTRRMSLLEVNGSSRYEAFDVYYPLLFRLRSDSVTLTVRRPGARARETLALALLSFAEREERASGGRHDPSGDATARWTLEWLDERTALLGMPTWATGESRDWKAWLTRSFGEIASRRAATVIVDLRGNDGGSDDVGRDLLSRFLTGRFRVETLERKLRYRKVPERLLPHLEAPDPSFRDWGNSVMEVGDGFYRRIVNTATDDVVEPAANGFGGEVFILVGAANRSATFRFAQAAQGSGRAKLVGQPTGGNPNGFNGGGFFFLELPNSGIEVDLPLVGHFASEPRPDRGLEPDLPVRPTAEAIAQGTDAEIAAVRAWQQARPPATRPRSTAR